MAMRTRTLGTVLAIVLAVHATPRAEAQAARPTDELVVGAGTYRADGGMFATFGNQGQQFAFQRWVRLPFAAYNAANGETRPACGDFDGDGRDELALGIGTYPASGGWAQVREDAASSFSRTRWLRLPWSPYNAANGASRPAAGNLQP